MHNKKLFNIYFKNLFTITFPTIILIFIILEICSRLFCPGREFPVTKYDTEYGILKFDPAISNNGIWTMGRFGQFRSKWRINNEGWNSPFDYNILKSKNIIRLAIIGDSYIEAFQVDIEKSYPYLLKKYLGDNFEVYSFGISDAPLSQYYNMARYVYQKFSPDVLIINVVHNDFIEAINGVKSLPYMMTFKLLQNNEVELVNPTVIDQSKGYYWLKRILLKSSLFRLIYGNWSLSSIATKVTGYKNVEMNVITDYLDDRIPDIQTIASNFCDRMHDEFKKTKIVVIMDGPRQFIYNDSLEKSTTYQLNRILSEQCQANGIPCLDLTKPMLDNYSRYKIHFESEYDGHWNHYGHYFVANQLYKLLQDSVFTKSERR